MRKLLWAGWLLLACAFPASAEVKVINGTGHELLLDVLSQAGQVRDVKLGPEVSAGLMVGPKSPPLQSEVLVVKSSDGAEKYRADVESGRMYILHLWNPYITTYVGEVRGEARNYYPRVVNAVGMEVGFEVTYPDFTQSKSSLKGPDGNSKVYYTDVGQARNGGDVVDVVLTPADGSAPLKTKLKCGVVYYLWREGEALKLQPIGTI